MFLFFLICVKAQLQNSWVGFIQYGNRSIFWKDQLTLNLTLINFLTGQVNNFDSINLAWTCTDLTYEKLCVDDQGSDLSFDNVTYQLTVPESTLQPDRNYKFSVNISGQYSQFISVIIYSTQNEVPLLELSYPYSILTRQVNYDEYIDFSIQLDPGLSPDDVQISVTVSYGNNVQGIQLLYPRLRFRLSDYFPPSNLDPDVCTVQFSMVVPGYLEIARQGIQYSVISPPRSGQILGNNQTEQLQETYSIAGATDSNTPLTYQFGIYIDVDQYISDKQNKQNNYKIDLQDYTVATSLQIILPYGQLVIACNIRDVLGATTQAYLNVTSNFTQFDISQLAQNVQTNSDVTMKIMNGIAMAMAYNGTPLSKQDSYTQNVNASLVYLKAFLANQTVEWVITSVQKVVWLIESTGVVFKSYTELNDRITYLVNMETLYRQTVVQKVQDLQSARTKMISDQFLGNTTSQDIFLYKSSYLGFLCLLLDGVYGTFDIFLGRMDIDTPYFYESAVSSNVSITKTFNSTNIKELFDNLTSTNKRRMLAQLERYDIQPDDQFIKDYRSKLNITTDTLDLIHLCYNRVVNLIHLLNLMSNELIQTNGQSILLEANYFKSFFKRTTASQINNYIVRQDYEISFTSQSALNYSRAAAYSGVWNLQNDTLDLSVQINEEDLNGDEQNYVASRNILMWENRDQFTDLSTIQSFTVDPSLLYLISIINFKVNPYYWRNITYQYSKWNSYSRSQKYISPQIMVQNGSDFQTALGITNYGFSASFEIDPQLNFSYYRCAQIISNFTSDNCTKVIVDNKTTNCYCNYISDIVLLQQYIAPDLRKITKVTKQNMTETVIGQTIFIMSVTFAIFMVISMVLDARSQRVIPEQQIVPMSGDDDQLEVFPAGDESRNMGKTFDATMIGPKFSRIYPTDKELRKNAFQKIQSEQQQTEKFMDSPKILDTVKESKSVLFSEPKIQFSKFKILKEKKKAENYDYVEDGFNDAACQYEPVFQSNLELGIRITTGDLIVKGIFKLHELLSIFIYFDPSFSRLSRMLSIYMKLMVMFVVCSYTINFLNTIEHIILVIFLGELSVFFINIVRAELNGTNLQKIVGTFLTLVVLSSCWIFYFFQVDGLDIDTADEWARQFIISYLSNHLLFDPILVVIKIALYPWTVQQMVANQQTPIAYLLHFLINHADMRALYQL